MVLHTNRIPVMLGGYPLRGFFCGLNSVPLDRYSGTFNKGNTDVVEKVNFLVAASQHGYFGGGRIPTARGQKWLFLVTYHGGILSCGFSQKRNSRI